MSRMNFGCFAAVFLALIAISTSSNAQIGTLLPRVDALTGGQHLSPIFDDVIQKTKFEKARESSRQVWQLEEPCTGACGENCSGDCDQSCQIADEVNLSEQIWTDADSLVATLPDYDCEKCGQCRGSPGCESATDEYCRQMAGLLVVTLNGSKADADAQRRAIETALKMVSENAQVQSEARFAKLESKYEKSMAKMQEQIGRLALEHNSVDQFKDWLRPIYASQNRNAEQIQSLVASNASLNNSIGLMGQRIANLAPAPRANEPLDMRFAQPHQQKSENRYLDVAISQFQKAAYEKAAYEKAAYEKAETIEIENLRQQIANLDRQLELLMKPNRRADHLEPIFTPDQPLAPLKNHYRK